MFFLLKWAANPHQTSRRSGTLAQGKTYEYYEVGFSSFAWCVTGSKWVIFHSYPIVYWSVCSQFSPLIHWFRLSSRFPGSLGDSSVNVIFWRANVAIFVECLIPDWTLLFLWGIYWTIYSFRVQRILRHFGTRGIVANFSGLDGLIHKSTHILSAPGKVWILVLGSQNCDSLGD